MRGVPLAPHAAALLATLLVELPLVVGLGPAAGGPAGPGWSWTLAAALGANLATHGALWIAFPHLPLPYAAAVAALEVAVVIAEGAALAGLAGWSAPRALGVSALANATSTAAGLFAHVGV